MTQFTDFLKPEVLFSRENPFLKSAAAAHRMLFETMDRTARLQLAFAGDMLDLNRDRFELLYAGKPFAEALDAQQELVTRFGKRAARHVGELQEVAASMRERVTDAAFEAANDPNRGAGRAAGSAKSRKAA